MVGGDEDRERADELLDLDGCAALLQVPPRRVRRWVRRGEFPAPVGRDGAPFWRRSDLWIWAVAQGPPLSGLAPLRYWPTATRACPADHGTGSRSQILIEARSMVPRNV